MTIVSRIRPDRIDQELIDIIIRTKGLSQFTWKLLEICKNRKSEKKSTVE